MNPDIIRQQIENLRLQFPDADPEDWELSLASETSIFELLEQIEERRQEAESMAESIALRRSALGERQARYERKVEAMRALAFKLMQAADVRKAELAIATLSISKGREKLVIPDDTAVPQHLCVVKYSPNKARIKELLEGGTQFNWAAIVMGDPSLTIRTK